MRTIDAKLITNTVANLSILANNHADSKIIAAISNAKNNEKNPLAKSALDMICKNMDIAANENMPMCQDTGMVVVFVEIGQEVYVNGNLEESINEGIRQGYKDGYLRASVINDPAKRQNTKDNTPAVIHYKVVTGDKLKISVMPKGFGSENKSALKMLVPSAGIDGVRDFVLETVIKAGGDACPPIVVGVGFGGTMEKCAILAKEALLHMFSETTNTFYANLENEWLNKINNLQIGAGGFGGSHTALAVKILTYPTHIAGLPVAVNIGCHVSRHKEAVL